MLDASRILELTNKACFLYVRQNRTKKAGLLRMVLSNRAIDAIGVYPTYRKQYGLIFQRAERLVGAVGIEK